MNYDAMVKKNLAALEAAFAEMKPVTKERCGAMVRDAVARMMPVKEPEGPPTTPLSFSIERATVNGEPVNLVLQNPGNITFPIPCKTTSTIPAWVDPLARAMVEDGIVKSPPAWNGVTTTSDGVSTFVKVIDDMPVDKSGISVPFFEEPAIEGDLPGTTGTFYTETFQTESPVEIIGGWPDKSEVKLIGLAPNRRMLRGTLGDGRLVSIERKQPWTAGAVVQTKLIRAGASPLYRIMA